MVDRFGGGTTHQLCLDPKCGFETESHASSAGRGVTEIQSGSEELAQLDAACREAERYLQSLPGDPVEDFAAEREHWVREGGDWAEEFDDLVTHFVGDGMSSLGAAGAASAKIYRLRSVLRTGQQEASLR